MTEVKRNRGGQPGNNQAGRGSMVRGAIRRALAENTSAGRDSMNLIVQKMIADAEQGEKDARRELFDRLDGKPNQVTDVNATIDATVMSGLGPVYGLHPTPET